MFSKIYNIFFIFLYLLLIISYFSSVLYFDYFNHVDCSITDNFVNHLPNNYDNATSDNNINVENKSKELIKVQTDSDNNNNKEYYSFRVEKDLVNKTLNSIGEAGKIALEQIAPNVGAGTAAGAATAAIVKATSGLPPLQRTVAIGGTALVTALSTKVGIAAGDSIIKNNKLIEEVKKSKHADTIIDRVPIYFFFYS
jgi:hypothetical protein